MGLAAGGEGLGDWVRGRRDLASACAFRLDLTVVHSSGVVAGAAAGVAMGATIGAGSVAGAAGATELAAVGVFGVAGATAGAAMGAPIGAESASATVMWPR